MTLLYPLGLIGLIGVPLLILIYILKSKYKETTVASTFLWELSDKFMKKKQPFSRLKGLLSLILQILCVIFVSLSLSHPILHLKDSAKNYLFILDESASMNMEYEGKTRFELALEEITSLINNSRDGSKYTLIEQNKSSSILYSYLESKEKAKTELNRLSPTTLNIDEVEAISLAQELFKEDSSFEVYYFTDKEYAKQENITVINCSNNEYNASIKNCSYEIVNDSFVIEGSFISYSETRDIEVQLIVPDTLKNDEEDKILASKIITANQNEDTLFSFTVPLDNYAYFLVLLNVEDSLEYDNYYYLFGNDSNGEFTTLLVSSNPFFLKNVISACGSSNIRVTSSYNGETGYDLYVFDSCSISSLPNDGSIILMNISSNVPSSMIIPQEKMTVSGGAKLSLSNEESIRYNDLSKDLLGNDIYVSEFMRYSLTKDFTTIYNYNEIPMVFAGNTSFDNKEVIFSFDVHNSSLPLNIDYVPLFRNIISYLLPPFIERTNFVAGEKIKINVLSNLESIRLNTSNNYSTYLPLSNSEIYYDLDYVGIYSLITTSKSNQTKAYYVYVSYPIEESNPIDFQEKIILYGDKSKGNCDSQFDLLFISFILLLCFIVVEWEVYVYDEHFI